MANTLLFYEYRDGANYATTGAVILSGEIAEQDKARLLAGFDEGSFFIPGQVGLPDLQDSFVTPSEWREEFDHPWHKMLEISTTDLAPNVPQGIVDLVDRVEKLSWDESYRPPFFEEMVKRRLAREAEEGEGPGM